MYIYLCMLKYKINNLMLFPYQLKDAYESTIPKHKNTLDEVNIFSHNNS